MKRPLKQKELELLSAYLDNQLIGKEKTRVETKIQSDKVWEIAFDNLQLTRKVLQRAPQIKIPHNFTLRPEMIKAQRRSFNSYPTMRLISSIASILFALVFVGDFVNKGVVPFSEASDQVSLSSNNFIDGTVGEPLAAVMADADSIDAPQEEMAPAPQADFSADDSLGGDQDQVASQDSNEEAEASSGAQNLQEDESTPSARITITAVPTMAVKDAPVEDTEVGSSDNKVETENENQKDVDEQAEINLGNEPEKENLEIKEPANRIVNLTKWVLGIIAISTGVQSIRKRRI